MEDLINTLKVGDENDIGAKLNQFNSQVSVLCSHSIANHINVILDLLEWSLISSCRSSSSKETAS